MLALVSCYGFVVVLVFGGAGGSFKKTANGTKYCLRSRRSPAGLLACFDATYGLYGVNE